MVKKIITIIRCDICDREEAKEFGFRYDRRMDAGGSMENVYYDADLCRIHADAVFHLHGHPDDYSERTVGRSKSLEYNSKIREWIEQQIDVWGNLSPDEKYLALTIEDL